MTNESKIKDVIRRILGQAETEDKMVDMLISLIQEERQGAVRNFVKWLADNGKDYTITWVDAEQYIKSLEDKDKEQG